MGRRRLAGEGLSGLDVVVGEFRRTASRTTLYRYIPAARAANLPGV